MLNENDKYRLWIGTLNNPDDHGETCLHSFLEEFHALLGCVHSRG